MGSIRKPELLMKPVKLTSSTLRLPSGSTLNIGAMQFNLTANLDLNTAVTGVGGCDVAVAAGSLYTVYAVVSSGTVYLIASLNSSLPTGFTQARAVGGFTTNASSQIDQVASQAGDLSIAGSLSSLGALSTPDTRNMIINGGFDFWQRGATASNPGGSGTIAYSTADRFWTQWDISAGTMALSKQTLTQAEKTTIGGGSKYFFRWDQSVGYASNSYRIIAQSVEGVSQFHSKPTTFSFWAKSSSNISVNPQIIVSSGSGGTGSYGWASLGTANITTTWQKFSFTLPVIDMSTWSVPNENTSYLAVSLWLPSALSTFTLDTTCWMLNEGYTAAPFQRAGGTIGGELALCQRYFEKSMPVDTAITNPDATNYVSAYICLRAIGANNCPVQRIFFKVPKRTTGANLTITPIGVVSAGTWRWYNIVDDSYVDVAPTITNNVNAKGADGFSPFLPGYNNRDSVLANWTADAEL